MNFRVRTNREKTPKKIDWKCPICRIKVPYRGMICDDCHLTRRDEIIAHKTKLQNNRKYECGEAITTLNELLEQEIVMWFGKPKHIEVIKSLQLRMILQFLNNNHFKKAIKKEEK